jgi:hypothetical protein
VGVYFFPCLLSSPATTLSRMVPQMRSKHQSLLPQNMERGRRGGKGQGQKTKKIKLSWNPWSLNTAFVTLFPKPRSTKKAGGFGADPFYTKTFKAGGGLENHPPTRKRNVSSLSTIAFASMMIQTPFQIERFWNLPGNIIMWVDISFPEISHRSWCF